MRRILLLLMALLTLLGRPGASEALENAAHALAEGHAVHGAVHGATDAHAPMHVEHGCGGGVHVCPCHASTVAVPARVTADIAAPSEESTLDLFAVEGRAPEGIRRAPFRPPTS